MNSSPSRHPQLPPQDLLRALRVAGDVDPLDVDRPALDDRDGHVDLEVRKVVRRARVDLGPSPPELRVPVHQGPHRVAQRPAVEDLALLEPDELADLLVGEELVARDRDRAGAELRALHDADAERNLLAREVGHDLRGLHAGLDVAVVGVGLEDAVHVVVEHLPLHRREREDPVDALLRRHRVLDLAGGQRLVALDHDAVDVELRPLLDPEHHPQVALRRALGARGDLDAEIPLVLVLLADGLLGLLDLDRVVEHANPDGGLFPELVVGQLRVALEADLAQERALHDREDHAHPAFELLGAHLHVVEEPEPEDRPDVVPKRGRRQRVADLRPHPVQDGRRLDPAVPLDDDVPNGRDELRGGCAGWVSWARAMPTRPRRATSAERRIRPPVGGLPRRRPPRGVKGTPRANGDREVSAPPGSVSARKPVRRRALRPALEPRSELHPESGPR